MIIMMMQLEVGAVDCGNSEKYSISISRASSLAADASLSLSQGDGEVYNGMNAVHCNSSDVQ